MSSSRAPESSADPDAPSRFAALRLSPRAAVVLAAVVVVVAVGVVLVGAVSGGSRSTEDARLSVTGAPSVGASGAGAPAGAVGSSAGIGGASGPGGAGGGAAAAVGPSGSASTTSVVVHVVGAVARPGIVTLPAGSRVSDAVRRAGDAGADADLTRLNLARVLVDGERLYVPRVGEVDIPQALDGGTGNGVAGAGGGSAAGGGGGAGGAGGAGAAGSDAAPVDLNAADQATLETLPGIGPSLAARILAWREEHGRFTSVEDLLDVSGIGDGRFADLRDRVRV